MVGKGDTQGGVEPAADYEAAASSAETTEARVFTIRSGRNLQGNATVRGEASGSLLRNSLWMLYGAARGAKRLRRYPFPFRPGTRFVEVG